MQYSTYKIQYLIEMTQYFTAWSNHWFFRCLNVERRKCGFGYLTFRIIDILLYLNVHYHQCERISNLVTLVSSGIFDSCSPALWYQERHACLQDTLMMSHTLRSGQINSHNSMGYTCGSCTVQMKYFWKRETIERKTLMNLNVTRKCDYETLKIDSIVTDHPRTGHEGPAGIVLLFL